MIHLRFLRRIATPIFRLSIPGLLLLACAVSSASPIDRKAQSPLRLRTIVVGSTGGEGRMPFEKADADGSLTGFSADYLRELLKEGPELTLKTRVYPDFPTLIRAACAGEVDLITSVDTTPERRRCLTFSAPYLQGSAAILGRRIDRRSADNARLEHARIAVLRGSVYEAELREKYPNARLVLLPFSDAVNAVKSGRADVFFGTSLALDYTLATQPDPDLEIVRYVPGSQVRLHFAAPQTNTQLIRLLDERQGRIPEATVKTLMDRWFGSRFSPPLPSALVELDLSPQERAYLRSLPPLRLGYGASWAPLTSLGEDRRLSGVASDYVDYLSRTLGISFDRTPVDDWSEIQREFNQGSIDVVVGASNGMPAVISGANSIALDTYPLVVVLKQSAVPVTGKQDLHDKRVGVLNGLIEGHAASESLPGAIIVNVKSDGDGFDQVAAGSIDAYVANLAVADSMLSARYVGQLKTGIPIERLQDVVFTVQDRMAPLIPLIDRALARVSETERTRIRNKWLAARFNYGVSWTTVASRLWPFAASIGFVLLFMVLAYLKQKKEVQRRVAVERTLEAQLNFQQTLMETAPYPILATDERRRYISVNRAAEDMFGLQRDELLGQTVTDSIPALRDLFASGADHAPELTYIGGDGQPRAALYRLASFGLPGEEGRGGVIAALVDLTDIRRAQAREAETAQRLGDLTRNLPAVVFQALMAKDGRLSFPFVSGNAASLFGISAHQMMESEASAMERIVPEDRELLIQEVRRSAEALDPARIEFRTHVNGLMLWLRGAAIPARQPDGSVLWSGYWADTTDERIQADVLREARDIAQQASRAKDEFLAMMSHEIRTPMNGVLGLVELLGRSPLNREQLHMVELAQESASTLLQVLDDILDYSKIEAGQLRLEYTQIDLRKLCDGVLGLLGGLAREKKLTMRVVIDAQVAASVHADGVRLRQILFNLLGNAIKFTERGTVNLHVAIKSEEVEHQGLVFTISDTGIGIPTEQRQNIFAPFVQAERSTTRRFGGTGLGLSICRKLVHMMDGEIALSSEPGVGTEVRVCLNLKPAELRYDFPSLRGRRVHVAVSDAAAAHALTQSVMALGMVPGQRAAAELEFVDEDQVGVPHDRPIIGVSSDFFPTGYWVDNGAAHVSTSPLLFSAVVHACMTSQAQDVDASHGSSALLPAHRPVPDREAELERGRLILVAEDNPINREVIRSQLHFLGHACDLVSNGLEALEALSQTRYGLLLTDMHMPHMSGDKLTLRVRGREAAGDPRLPIVGITAGTEQSDLVEGQRAGMDACLIKPVQLAELQECLARWLPSQASGPREGSQPPGVDLTGLRRLYTDDRAMVEFLHLVIPSLKGDIDTLRRLVDQDDVAGLNGHLHHMAGSLGVLQMSALQVEFADLRRNLAMTTAAQRKETVTSLAHECEQQVAALERLVGELGGDVSQG